MSTGELYIHRIDNPDDKNVRHVLAMSNAVFSVDGSTKHGSLDYWQTSLKHPDSFILYLADGLQKPVGFIFVIWRTHIPPLQNGVTASSHIWLAGILPEYRKAGSLARLVAELDSIRQVTVCTYPSRFPNMWRWLTSRGWVQEQSWENGKIMFSRARE